MSQRDFSKKEADILAAARERKARHDEMLKAADEFIKANELHYVAAQDRFIYKADRTWKLLTTQAVKNRFAIMQHPEFWQAAHEIMEQLDWKHEDLTYTYAEPAPGLFNMLTRENWVQPQVGEHHWIFDLVMFRVSGSKRDNRRHLEHLIAYKYLHPAYYLLPCVLIYGEGGVGKNLLVDKILYRLFGGQTISATSNLLIGDFNSLVKGMAAMLLNEQMSSAEEARKLKDMLHKERLAMNEKNVKQYVIDNTPMIFIGSNSKDGGYLLERSDADRRLSVFHCPPGQTLITAIAEHNKWSQERSHQWMVEEGNSICGNPDEIAKWIGNLMVTYVDAGIPMAHHNGDHSVLVNTQKRWDERIMEAVFGDEDFTHIERKVLYEGYVLHAEKERYRLGDVTFNNHVKEWLAKNRKDIILKERCDRGSARKKRHYWALADVTIGEENRTKYVLEDGFKSKWVGPDLALGDESAAVSADDSGSNGRQFAAASVEAIRRNLQSMRH